MRKINRQILLASALSCVLPLIASCGGDNTEVSQEPPVRPVKLLTLEAASELTTSRYPAVVNAGRFRELSFPVGGLIQNLAIVEAQEVEAQDIIASLDQREFQNNVVSARSQFQNAEEEFQRAERLAQQDAIARSVLEERRSRRDVARAQLDTAEKALQDTVLTAPFNGVVARLPVRELETVAAGQLVAALIDTDVLEVTVDIPARVIAESLAVEGL